MGRKGRNRIRNSYVGGALVLAVSNILCRFLGFVFKVPLANLIGAEGMGYYSFAFQIFNVVSTAAVSGLPVALSRTVAASPENERLPILRSSLRLFCIAGGVGTAVLLLFAGGISELAGSAPSKLAVMALAPTTLFVAVESAYRGYFQGKADMTPPAVSQAADAVTKLVLGTAAAWYLYRAGYPAEVVAAGAILGVTVGTLVSAAVLVVSARGEYRRAGGKRGKPIRLHGIKRRLLRLAFPLTVGALFLSMVNTVDAMVVMNRLQGTGLSQSEATGAYGAYTGIALTVYSLPSAITSAICASVIPAVASVGDFATADAKSRQRAYKYLKTSFRLASVVVFLAAALFAVMPRELLSLLFSRSGDVAAAAPLLRILAPATVLSAFCSLSAAALHAMGMMTVPVVAMAAGGFVKLALNFWLIGNPEIRVMGAPVGTVACFAVAAVINFAYIARRTGFLPPVWDCMVKPAACAMLAAFTALSLYNAFIIPLGARLAGLLALCTAALLYFFLLVFTGVLKREDGKMLSHTA